MAPTTRSHHIDLSSHARPGDLISLLMTIPLPLSLFHLLSHISPVALGLTAFDTLTEGHLARVPGDQPRVTVGTFLTFEAWSGSLFICHPRSFEAPFLPRFIRYLARSLSNSRLTRSHAPRICHIQSSRRVVRGSGVVWGRNVGKLSIGTWEVVRNWGEGEQEKEIGW